MEDNWKKIDKSNLKQELCILLLANKKVPKVPAPYSERILKLLTKFFAIVCSKKKKKIKNFMHKYAMSILISLRKYRVVIDINKNGVC